MAVHSGWRGPGHLSRWSPVFVAPATTAPTLSSPTAVALGGTTGSSSVVTDEANGTIYAFLSLSPSPPTAADLKTGTGAVSSASQTVTAVSSQTVNWSGLTSETTYYTYWLHTNAASNDSDIASDTGFTTLDVTAPVLSSPIASTTGAPTATIGVTTNEGNGTLYGFISTSSSAPTATALKAGTGAAWFGNRAVTSPGAKTFGATGIGYATTYYSYFLHSDASGNESAIAAASSFTTAAAGAVLSDLTMTQTASGPLGLYFNAAANSQYIPLLFRTF